RRGFRITLTGSDGLEDRIESRHHFVLATDHQAVPAIQAPYSTGGSTVHVVNLVGGQLLGAADVVAVEGVAAVHDHVVGVEQRNELVERGPYGRRGHHEPDDARPVELLDEVRKRGGADHALAGEFRNGAFRARVASGLVAVADQSAHQVRTHPPQPYHAN